VTLVIGAIDGLVEVPYAGHEVRFAGPQSLCATHTLLLKNVGTESIRSLNVLYPACLISEERLPDELIVDLPVIDLTHKLQRARGFSAVAGGVAKLQLTLPEPDCPDELPVIAGYWRPGDMHFDMPDAIKMSPQRTITIFRSLGFTAWNLLLTRPLKPKEALWWRVRINVERTGTYVPGGLRSPHVYHEIESPFDVRRRVKRVLKLALEQEWGDERLSTALASLEGGLGSFRGREVVWKCYDLTIRTGDTENQFPLQCSSQGNIQSRSGSPALEQSQANGTSYKELVWRFRSAPSCPSPESSFLVRIHLACADSSSP